MLNLRNEAQFSMSKLNLQQCLATGRKKIPCFTVDFVKCEKKQTFQILKKNQGSQSFHIKIIH